jgi:hypothetical protein
VKPLREWTPTRPVELDLEQRLEVLEAAVQRLADASAWRKRLDELVPAGEPVVVLAETSMLPFETLDRPVIGVLPDTNDCLAGVARLEAQRAQGVRFVLVPDAVRSRVEQDAHLSEHLREHFRVIASDPGIGALLEVSADTGDEVEIPTLEGLIDSLALRDRFAPILDWTSLELATSSTGWTFFRPIEPDAGKLPYLDHTIGVVLVDDAERMDEAERVAAEAAVLVATDGTAGVIAAETRLIRSASSSERPAEPEQSAIVLAEPGVVPLPGCIEAAERFLAANPQVGGVAVKLFDADGKLEAAGAAAFADGSVHAIAGGAPVSAPWHEYVRAVPAVVGLVVLRPAAARECAIGDKEDASDLAGVSARLWSAGWELHYQPDAAAVRALEPAARGAAVWPEPPRGFPERPGVFDAASWRGLLARDEVGAVR